MRRRRQTHKRGRTRPRRMALIDALFEDGQFELPTEGIAVDLGYGDAPTTCVEWAAALKPHFPQLSVIGVEVEPARVEAARTLCHDLEFREGDFELRCCPETVSAIRCMNVLRGYGLDEALAARDLMLSRLTPRGLLIEGTSDTEGHLLGAHFWRATGDGPGVYEGLLLATDFTRGFAPRMFRDVLPRDLRRHVIPGEAIFDVLEHFEGLTAAARVPGANNETVFKQAATQLAEQRSDIVVLASGRSESGSLLWRPERPSPRS